VFYLKERLKSILEKEAGLEGKGNQLRINWANIPIKELAGIIGKHLNNHGIEVVLVGGSCVSIYSNNKYVSKDLDYVTYEPIKKIKPVLESIGFNQRIGRHFEHKKCPYYLEFLSAPVAIGEQYPINKFNKIRTKMGIVQLLTPSDCVKDRLAAYFHWNDMQSLEQAVLVAGNNKINIKDIEKWSANEGNKEKFKIFYQKYRETPHLK